jgi:uncharacterized membrane protein YfcA
MNNPWLKYSGMALQFVLIILIGYWLGGFLGNKLQLKKGNGELIGMMFFLVTGLYKIIRDLKKDQGS